VPAFTRRPGRAPEQLPPRRARRLYLRCCSFPTLSPISATATESCCSPELPPQLLLLQDALIALLFDELPD
jgi:hypothetical protein